MGTLSKRRLAMAIAALLLLAACARSGADPTAPAADDADATPGGSRPVPSFDVISPSPEDSMDGSRGAIPDTVLEPILADAAERTGLPRADLVVTRAEAVTWNDGSLGCPEPGMLYTQALVDGYHVVIGADDERLDYRVGGGAAFKLCGRPFAPPSGNSRDS